MSFFEVKNMKFDNEADNVISFSFAVLFSYFGGKIPFFSLQMFSQPFGNMPVVTSG